MSQGASPSLNVFRTFVAIAIALTGAIDAIVLATSDDSSTVAQQSSIPGGGSEQDPPPTDPTDVVTEPTEVIVATLIEEPSSDKVPAQLSLVSASASASAPSVTGPGGETLGYGPELAIDGRNDTAWCVEGDGAGQFLRVDFASVAAVTHIAIIPGYDKIDPTTGDDRFKENRKIHEVFYAFAGGTPVFESFSEPLRELKITELGRPIETTFVQIEPSFTSGSTQANRNYTCISEVVVAGLLP